MKRISKRILALFFACIMMVGLVSCEIRPITSTKQAKAAVGTVGEFDVSYEEFYSLVQNYRSQLDFKYDGVDISKEAYTEELRTLVYDNIVTNYAVLTLAKSEGLSIDSDEIRSDVQKSLEVMIASDFGGKRSQYKRSLKENGLTDSYVRFSLAVDALYSKLTSLYLDKGVINDNDAYIKDYIKNEFARTWHIMLVNDGRDETLSMIKEAKALLESGKTMYQMIGSKYNQDYMLTTLDGYYFPKGVMEKAYEDAVFELEIGEISDIVLSEGKDSSGNVVDCYYIIQRLEPEDAYINKHFDDLKEDYYGAAMYDRVSKLQESLKFAPNDYCKSLDLTELEAPKTVDYVVVVAIVSIALAIGVVVLVCLLLVRRIKKRNADILGTTKAKELRAPRKKN